MVSLSEKVMEKKQEKGQKGQLKLPRSAELMRRNGEDCVFPIRHEEIKILMAKRMQNCCLLNTAKLAVVITQIVTLFKTNTAYIYYMGNRKP